MFIAYQHRCTALVCGRVYFKKFFIMYFSPVACTRYFNPTKSQAGYLTACVKTSGVLVMYVMISVSFESVLCSGRLIPFLINRNSRFAWSFQSDPFRSDVPLSTPLHCTKLLTGKVFCVMGFSRFLWVLVMTMITLFSGWRPSRFDLKSNIVWIRAVVIGPITDGHSVKNYILARIFHRFTQNLVVFFM